MPEPFGSFGWICSHAPLPQCNLFFAQLWRGGSNWSLEILFPQTSEFWYEYQVNSTNTIRDPNVIDAKGDAGTGVGMDCVIPRAGREDSVGDIVTVIMLFISILLGAGLITHAMRRKAALGRKEMSLLMGGYAVMSLLGMVTTTSLLEQASSEIIALSALHCAVMAAVPWFLLQNAIVSTELIEDGTPMSILGSSTLGLVTFGVALWVSVATGLDTQDVFRFRDDPTAIYLRSDGLFVLTLVWPAVAVVAYVGVMLYVVLVRTQEARQLVYLSASVFLFAAGQVVIFLCSQPICESTDSRVNGAFLTAILNNGALLAVYAMWLFLTEDEWDDIRWSQTDMQPMPMTEVVVPCRY